MTTRRTYLRNAAIAGTGLLAACAPNQGRQSTSPVTQTLQPADLEFYNHWVGETSPGARGWEAVIGKFQAAHPNIKVQRVNHASGVLNEKVIAAAAAGTPPNLIDLSPTAYAASAPKGLLLKLDTFLKSGTRLKREAILPAAQEMITLNSGTFAVPSEFGTLLLYYNADLLQENGIKLPETSWRWEGDFLDAARRATRDNGSPDTDRYGVEHIFNGWWSGQWWVPVWSNGGDILTKNHKKLALAEPPAVQGIQYLGDLAHRWRLTPSAEARKTSPQGRPFFETGRLAFFPNGSFYYAQAKENARFKWGVAQIPQGKAGSRPGTNGWLTGIGAESKHQEASWAFLSFYLQPENYSEFLRFVSWTPPIKAIERPPLVEETKDWTAMTGAAQNARTLPLLPQMDDVLKVIREGLTAVFVEGSKSAQAAVQELTPKANALL